MDIFRTPSLRTPRGGLPRTGDSRRLAKSAEITIFWGTYLFHREIDQFWCWVTTFVSNVHSFVTFPYRWLPWVVLRDFSQCRLHPLLLESKKNHRILFTGHWTFFKRHLRGQCWSHCWFWCRWRFRPFLSGLGSNIHWALHPPICQCKGCYHKKKVEEEHRQPHRWNREQLTFVRVINEDIVWSSLG